MRVLAAVLVLPLAGCLAPAPLGPAPGYGPPGNAPQAGGPCLPIVPMQLVAMHAGYAKPIASLAPDGTILQHGRHQPTLIGRIAGDQVFGPGGELVMTCLPNRVLATPTLPQGGWFDAQDQYVDRVGTTIGVGPDGSVYMGRQGGMGTVRVEGGYAVARRSAVVLVMMALGAGFSRRMTEGEAPGAPVVAALAEER